GGGIVGDGQGGKQPEAKNENQKLTKHVAGFHETGEVATSGRATERDRPHTFPGIPSLLSAGRPNNRRCRVPERYNPLVRSNRSGRDRSPCPAGEAAAEAATRCTM